MCCNFISFIPHDEGYLTDITHKAQGPQVRGLRVYVSSKSQEHMLQLLCNTSAKVFESQGINSQCFPFQQTSWIRAHNYYCV